MANQKVLAEQKVPRNSLSKTFNLEFLPANYDLNDYLQVEEIEQTQEQAQETVVRAANGLGKRTSDGIPIPLTEAEAEEADRQIQNTLQRITATQERIRVALTDIDKQITAAGKGELQFKLDISNKPRLKRAIKKLFGFKTDTITYSMYKEMIDAKMKLERQERDDYLSGKDLNATSTSKDESNPPSKPSLIPKPFTGPVTSGNDRFTGPVTSGNDRFSAPVTSGNDK